MTREERHAAIRRVIASRSGDAPSVRAMARMIGAGWRIVARDYHTLGIVSAAPNGRPSTGKGVPLEVRIPAALYDSYCHVARVRRVPLSAVIRAVLIIRSPLR